MYKLCVYTVATIHHIVAASLFLSLFIVPFVTTYWIALPIIVTVVRIMTSTDRCILTELEQYLRKRAGMYVIHGYVGHYWIKLPKLLIKYINNQWDSTINKK